MTTAPFERKLINNWKLEQRDSAFTSSERIPRTVAEYFAGIGLVRLGLENAGWNVIFANDFSLDKYEMYRGYFDNAKRHYIVDDIFNLKPQEIPPTLLATSSFPCIDLSLAGKQTGINGQHSSAFWGFIRLLKAQGVLAPPLILLENVPGWLSSNNGQDFRITVKALNDLGYHCDAFILDARRFTPQSRLRVFLIGARVLPDNTDMSFLKVRQKSLTNTRLEKAIRSNPDLNWFHFPIPDPPQLRKTGLGKDIIEEMPNDDPRWWDRVEVDRHLDMMTQSHRVRVEELRNGSSWSYRTIYRRVRSGQQRAEVRKTDTAGCLRTAIGGSSRQLVVSAGFGKVRMRHMTPREYARLQGVPDDYPIDVNEIQALTGFGDAVCVPAITWIANNIINPMADQLIFHALE